MKADETGFASVSKLVSSDPVVSIITFYTGGVQPLPVVTISLVLDLHTYHITLQKYNDKWSIGDTSEAYLYAQEQDQRLLKAIMQCLHLKSTEDSFQALSDYLDYINASALCDNEFRNIINFYK
jgi:hypothetical protein